MGAISPANGKIRVHPDVVWRDVDGEVVLLNVVTGQYFGLDSVGSTVWKLLLEHGDEGASLQALTARVIEIFDVDGPTAEGDLIALFTQLVDQQLIFVVA